MTTFNQMIRRSHRWYSNEEAVRWNFRPDRCCDIKECLEAVRTANDLVGVAMLADHHNVVNEVRNYGSISIK